MVRHGGEADEVTEPQKQNEIAVDKEQCSGTIPLFIPEQLDLLIKGNDVFI